MKLNPIKKVLAGAGGVATLALIGAGVFGVQDATAGIANTKHNLSGNMGTSGTRTNSFTGAGEICVFCHTPHGSDTTAAVPLWNRKLGGATYTTYNSLGTSTLDGSTVQVGSVSIACLSCHDGTQAMNSVINAPGSGNYNSAGNQTTNMGTASGARMTTDGKMAADIITNIGVDLRNDHPVGIQYAGGFKSAGSVTALPTTGEYASTNFNDPDFKPARATSANGSTVWWVDTGGNTSREKTDMLLYSRKGAVVVKQDGTNGDTLADTAQPFVECASCHDPHSETTTFLRIENTNSAVCLACHIK